MSSSDDKNRTSTAMEEFRKSLRKSYAKYERISGRYQLVKKLGQGGIGEVYHARDRQLDRDVAIKFLHVTLLARENAYCKT